MNKAEMVAWLRTRAMDEKSTGDWFRDEAQLAYARGIEEAANEVEERLT